MKNTFNILGFPQTLMLGTSSEGTEHYTSYLTGKTRSAAKILEDCEDWPAYFCPYDNHIDEALWEKMTKQLKSKIMAKCIQKKLDNMVQATPAESK